MRRGGVTGPTPAQHRPADVGEDLPAGVVALRRHAAQLVQQLRRHLLACRPARRPQQRHHRTRLLRGVRAHRRHRVPAQLQRAGQEVHRHGGRLRALGDGEKRLAEQQPRAPVGAVLPVLCHDRQQLLQHGRPALPRQRGQQLAQVLHRLSPHRQAVVLHQRQKDVRKLVLPAAAILRQLRQEVQRGRERGADGRLRARREGA
mmetsp:Transcript_10373/g.26382  ORF Transcript_10373/g.26382 Transcript_10373/m.26382 type:complete len:203 (-) Transcript_10373:212-820(-)